MLFRRSRSAVLLTVFYLMGSLKMNAGVNAAESEADPSARKFLAGQEVGIRPLETAAALAWWNAKVTGKDEDFQAKEEAQNRLDAALGDHEKFAELKALKSGKIDDPILARAVQVLYLIYLE